MTRKSHVALFTSIFIVDNILLNICQVNLSMKSKLLDVIGVK